MAFLSTFSAVRKAYKASITNGLKKIINFISSIHKFLGEILEINRFVEILPCRDRADTNCDLFTHEVFPSGFGKN